MATLPPGALAELVGDVVSAYKPSPPWESSLMTTAALGVVVLLLESWIEFRTGTGAVNVKIGAGVNVLVELTALAPRIAAPATPAPWSSAKAESLRLSVNVSAAAMLLPPFDGVKAIFTVQLAPAASEKDVPVHVPPGTMLNGKASPPCWLIVSGLVPPFSTVRLLVTLAPAATDPNSRRLGVTCNGFSLNPKREAL
jgi:hypothetical protein